MPDEKISIVGKVPAPVPQPTMIEFFGVVKPVESLAVVVDGKTIAEYIVPRDKTAEVRVTLAGMEK
ncbi:MAG: hypothetical protein WC822_02265 [Candidatus Paceibacterota bacterium]|jgi:hypothetical protein